MREIDIRDAAVNLDALVQEAADGRSFVITKAGAPLAKVIAAVDIAPTTRLGSLQGQLKFPDDFDRFGESEIAELFGETK